jgi:hypothetical protein
MRSRRVAAFSAERCLGVRTGATGSTSARANSDVHAAQRSFRLALPHKQVLQRLATAGSAVFAAFALQTAQAEEVTFKFKASKDPAMREAQTQLVQTYGAHACCVPQLMLCA